ncbi:endoglucanase 3 [Hordeum vulgare]|nr:endoglucanase 3 [Hordeum vulgare]
MASAVRKRQQLAPTMGPSTAPVEVTLHSGPLANSIGSLASGLISTPVEVSHAGVSVVLIVGSACPAGPAAVPIDEPHRGDVTADVGRLCTLFSNLHLNDEARCLGATIESTTFPRSLASCASMTRLRLTSTLSRGNKQVVVRYVPIMLTSSDRTSLNSLPASSVNNWVDFEEAFIHKFAGTYKRPGRPRELATCVQKPDEPLPDYVTRWTELHNSCEGVHEVQPSSTSSRAAETAPCYCNKRTSNSTRNRSVDGTRNPPATATP